MPRNIFKVVISVLAGLTLLVTGALLFFENKVKQIWQNGDEQAHEAPSDRGRLVIAYATPLTTLEPTSFQGTDRARIGNIYEPLIRPDRNFAIEPILAVSYGIIKPTVWEITLRGGVKFHDGSDFDSADAQASIQRARTHEASQLKDVLKTIAKVEIKGPHTLNIHTKEPDPLLLNKLSAVYMLPSENENPERKAIGTGPYIFVSWKANTETVLKKNTAYWGNAPAFSEVQIRTMPKKQDRIVSLQDGTVDMLVNVPPQSAGELGKNVNIISIPSLEVSFIMFTARDKALRKTVARAIDRQRLVDMTFGFAHPVNQFVSNGVFGYNSDIAPIRHVKESDIGEASFRLDIVEGLEEFGKTLREMLEEANITLETNFMTWTQLNKKIIQKDKDGDEKSDGYFLTWRSELGDSFDFLNSVAHSKGEFNGTGYENRAVDKLIMESSHEMNPKKRLQMLKKAMKIITEEDIIGTPLIEAETIFALQRGINWQPRLDGMVFAADIR